MQKKVRAVEDNKKILQVKKNALVQISRDNLTTPIGMDGQNNVGGGSYGDCQRMVYNGNLPVIVKILKSYVNLVDVLHEADVLQDLQALQHHHHLPLLLGIITHEKPYLLVTQFCR